MEKNKLYSDSEPLNSGVHFDMTFWQYIFFRIRCLWPFGKRPSLSSDSFELVDIISDNKGLFKIKK